MQSAGGLTDTQDAPPHTHTHTLTLAAPTKARDPTGDREDKATEGGAEKDGKEARV